MHSTPSNGFKGCLFQFR
uniref:Uncharacterized protein n=1 Tax=Anguilla anguilla TaxID=7936 RepID=A0A0E9Q7F0_ANGAN